MSDDFFAAPATAASAATWPPGVGRAESTPAAGSDAARYAGLAAVASAALTCLGAWGAWLSVSAQDVSVSIGGLSRHLAGHDALVMGVIGLALAVGIVVVREPGPARSALLVATAVVGLVGLGFSVYEFTHISTQVQDVAALVGSLGVHIGPGWGLWADGVGFTGLLVAAITAAVI